VRNAYEAVGLAGRFDVPMPKNCRMKKRKVLVADLLCGAGGSSTGCRYALNELGLDMELVCVNHWPVAIETHKRNHPEARHYIEDIAAVRPHILVPEGYLDLLMASPTCTHHSVARGGKPTSDQQRSDPWHIITWFTELRVKRAIIENVWEFIKWGPVDPRTMRPIKSREGEYFNTWKDTIRRLGATSIEYRKLNAADYGDATTRQRFIMMIRFDRHRIIWPAATHGCGPGLKPWRAAREIIDWRIRGTSLFGRPRPLAPKTIARILAGAVKFRWPAPFVVRLLGELERSLAYHVRKQYQARHDGGRSDRRLRRKRVRHGLTWLRKLRTETTTIHPLDSAEPVIIALRNHGEGRSVALPMPTVAANGTHIGLATPIILSQHTSGSARSTNDPLPTITTGGAGSHGHPGCARPAVVEPFILSRQGGGAPRSTDQPAPTQTAKHSHILIAPYYGRGSGTTCSTADQPVPTITAKPRFGIVVGVTHTKGAGRSRSLDAPLPTLTTAKGGEYALVLPVTHAGGLTRVIDPAADPLPTVTGAHRGELAFITAQHGERPGQTPRVHSADNPTPTIAATGHVDLVEGTEDYDILFRMLDPERELAPAMGLDGYNFAGTKTEKTKQIGNAVARRMMQACVRAAMSDTAPRRTFNPLALAAE
jgi:DNA (cytosine-5)-methyltransferase 1